MMRSVIKFGVVFIVCTVCALDINDETEGTAERKGLSQYNQKLTSMDHLPARSTWSPAPREPVLKRRRIRKRKRRPIILTSTEDTPRTTIKQQLFDHVKEPWEEMSAESSQKSYHRRRLTPSFDDIDAVESKTQTYEKIRDPFTALQEAEEKQRNKPEAEVPDLKTFLKQNDGVSLSEVLQQKNLSLSELLMGNQNAILALTAKAEPTTEKLIPKTKPTLPITSAKIGRTTPKSPTIPLNAVTISVNEIFGFKFPQEDGPLKMSFNLEETTTTAPEKMQRVTAIEEIMELLRNPLERDDLTRILKTRNMTVEELVQLRERGSSQLHLADIFHNETREPEPVEEAFVGIIPSNFERQGKSRTFTTTEATETIKPQYTITSFPTYKIETNKDVSLPLWQQLYPSIFPETVVTTENAERIHDIGNVLAEVANLDQTIDDDEFIRLPSGVKSAILASLVIIALSLLVFLTILVIFKWSQRQKRKRTYKESSSRSKILSDQKRSFRSFVCETLGRKKNYYKTHFHSMSDSNSIWNNDSEKNSYMI